jgi:hypothetical protein
MGGAGQFLSALNGDPGQSAAALLPKAAAANRNIFYDAAGAPRSVGGVMELLRGKLAAAMDGGAAPAWVEYGNPQFASAPSISAPETGGPIAREFQAAQREAASAAGSARQSMADTLRTTFGAASGDGQAAVPAHVRAAYGQLKRFDL